MFKNCGNCAHARVSPDNLQARICRGAPPQVVVLPGVNGQLQLQHRWPIVEAKDEGCGLHKMKVILDAAEAKEVKQ